MAEGRHKIMPELPFLHLTANCACQVWLASRCSRRKTTSQKSDSQFSRRDLHSVCKNEGTTEAVDEFNDLVNMTASEVGKWLESDESQSAGWPKETEDGNSIGHSSGRKIVDILDANPSKDVDRYTDDHIQHMRKVGSYWYGPGSLQEQCGRRSRHKLT